MPFNPPSTPLPLPDAHAYTAARYTLTATRLLWSTVAGIYADRLRMVATQAFDPTTVNSLNAIYASRSLAWEVVQRLSPEVAQLAAFAAIRTTEHQYWQVGLSMDSETVAGADAVVGDATDGEYRAADGHRDPGAPMSDLSYGLGPENWDREVSVIGPCVVSPDVSGDRTQRMTVRLTLGQLCMAEIAVLGFAIYEVPYRTLENT